MMSTIAQMSCDLSIQLTDTREALLEMADLLYLRSGPSNAICQVCCNAGYRICVTCREKSDLPSDYLKLGECEECKNE